MEPIDSTKYDVLIIGAGLSGISCIYHIRRLFPTWTLKVIESADQVGGTWYFNRYPGARFDSESISYQLSWDKEFLEQWDWAEEFAPQAETLRYIQAFCDKNDIHKDIQFNTTVATAVWQDETRTWLISDTNGNQLASRFLITCAGILSTPQLPNIAGIDNFKGQSYHTSRWPKDFDIAKDLKGKRIGVIGTGATGIQTITAISKEPSIGSLKVFQRTASWSAPLRNQPITPEKMAHYKRNYSQMWEQLSNTPTGFLHNPDPRKTFDVSDKERIALWEQRYNEAGFSKYIAVFADAYKDPAANKLYSDWMANKIRSRVNDPVIAEKLVPKDHGFGTKRLPLESGYFEAFNKPNVHLIDIREHPISSVTENSIVTSDGAEHELDVLVYATGFDAITGALAAIDWRAKDNRPLFGSSDALEEKKAIWADNETRTLLGIMAPALPNVFMVLGPHQPLGNVPRTIENGVKIIMDLLQFADRNGYTYLEPTQEAADDWYDHVVEVGKGLLANEVGSWSTGYNPNMAGRDKPRVARYAGSFQEYLAKYRQIVDSKWKSLHLA